MVGAAFTVNLLAPMPLPPSGLRTVTLRVPVVALEAMVTFAVTCVALLNVVLLTVIPEPENDAPAPFWKPVPVMTTLRFVAPCPPEVAAVTVGNAFTVNTLVPTPVPASGFTTVMLPPPKAAAPAIVMFAVTWFALLNVVELTVIPAPENAAVAPLTKPLPAITMF